MNYQLTCVCGNRFFVTEDQVAHQVTCPACGRTLQPVVTAPPKDPPMQSASTIPPTATTGATPGVIAASAEATKRCPFCGEVILAIARKCKHCGEFLDHAPPAGGAPATTPTAPPAANLSPQSPTPVPPSDIPPIFSLSVSQWDNFWKFVTLAIIVIIISAILIKVPQLIEYRQTGILGTVVLAGFIAWFFYIQTRSSRCYIRPTRIETEVGVLSKDLTTLELFRITDMDLKQNILERIIGIGTIRVTSNDPQTPELILYEIPQARRVYKYLQDQIPVATKQRGAIFMEK